MSGRLREFIKAQLSAFLGGMTDLGIYTLCYTVLLYSAPVSNMISGSLGAVMNFVINRHWSFKVTERSVGSQLWKFIIVVIGSITLKTFGIYVLVDCWFWHFLISKLIVELVVSLGFNFTLQKFWVFRK